MGAFSSAAVGPVLASTLIALSVLCAITDLWRGRIYNVITYPAIASGFVLHAALGGAPGLWQALAGFAAGFLPALVLFAAGGLGGGDVKLLGAVGALSGAGPACEALLLALLVGAFMALGKLAWHGLLFRTLWRLVVSAVRGRSLLKYAKQDAPPPLTIRFGVAICVATLMTLLDLNSGTLMGWVR